MSADFIEDAMDSLQKSGASFILISSHPTNPNLCYRCTDISNQAQLEWFERRFAEVASTLRERLTH